MSSRSTTLRAALATAILASTAAGVATAAGSLACDPMYPCVADATTPPAVYDVSFRRAETADDLVLVDLDHATGAPRLAANGLGGKRFEARSASGDGASPAAVYDLEARTDHGPCASYPCYPEQAEAVRPIAADATVALRGVDQRG